MEIPEDKLKELQNTGQTLWCMHFGEKTPLPDCMDYISSVAWDLPLVDYLISNRFHHLTAEHSTRSQWKSAIYYTLKRLLKSNDERAVVFIDLFAEQLSFLKFVSFDCQLVKQAHNGRYAERYRRDAIDLSLLKYPNQDILQGEFSLFINTMDLDALAREWRSLALEVLPNMVEKWELTYQKSAATILVDQCGSQCPEHVNLRDLSEKNFNSAYFQSDKCLDLITSQMKHIANTRGVPEIDQEVYEKHLVYLADTYKHPTIIDYLSNKWNNSSWRDLRVTLDNSWTFPFRRHPFSEICALSIPSSERGRDNIVPDDQEQLDWTHDILSSFKEGSYGATWEVDFTIRGESLLQHLLAQLKARGVKSWWETPATTYTDELS